MLSVPRTVCFFSSRTFSLPALSTSTRRDVTSCSRMLNSTRRFFSRPSSLAGAESCACALPQHGTAFTVADSRALAIPVVQVSHWWTIHADAPVSSTTNYGIIPSQWCQPLFIMMAASIYHATAFAPSSQTFNHDDLLPDQTSELYITSVLINKPHLWSQYTNYDP